MMAPPVSLSADADGATAASRAVPVLVMESVPDSSSEAAGA